MRGATNRLQDDNLFSVDMVSLESVPQVVEVCFGTVTKSIAIYPGAIVLWYPENYKLMKVLR